MKRPVVIFIGVAFTVGLVALIGWRIAQSKARNADAAAAAAVVPVPTVSIATVEKKDLPEIVTITGSIKPRNEATVFAKMPGRITRVHVELGQIVKAGAPLASIDGSDLVLRVRQADAQLAAAMTGLDNAKIQEEQAARIFARASSLREKGSMSQMEFEQAESGAKLAKAGVQAASSQVALADAARNLAQKAFSDTLVTAPFNGVVAKKSAQIGSEANPGQPLFTVQDQSGLKLEGTVPAAFVPRLAPGLAVAIIIDELPGKIFSGSVARIAPSLDADTRRGAIEIAVDKGDGILPHMFARAEIAFGKSADAIVVPASAVLTVGGEDSLYVVRDGRAVLVRPRIRTRYLDDVIIDEGVEVGDKVIISGSAGLKDGIQVRLPDT